MINYYEPTQLERQLARTYCLELATLKHRVISAWDRYKHQSEGPQRQQYYRVWSELSSKLVATY